MLIDTHAHLNDPAFSSDLPEVMERALSAGVENIIVVGYDVPSSLRAVELALQWKGIIKAAVGIHPHEADEAHEAAKREIARLAREEMVVAVGETGVDYYRCLSSREAQQELFRWHLELAQQLQKPVVVHSREAFADTLAILREFSPGVKGVMHCFSGSWEMAREFLRLGFFISLAGPVTFRNARKPKEVALHTPLDKLLIETDCPYLAPEPFRGKRNEPSYLKYIALAVAEIKGLSWEEIAQATSCNAQKLFCDSRAFRPI